MKYYCEKCKKFYNTVEEAEIHEAQHNKLNDEYKKLKEEKDKRHQEVLDACENYNKLLDKYIKDYGSYKLNNFSFIWR